MILRVVALLLFSCSVLAGPAEDAALAEISAFTTLQARTDPHFKQAEAQVLAKVDGIVASAPPADWLPAIRRQYLAASERAHREERERIQQSEYAVYQAIGAPTDATRGSRLEQRLEQLAADLEGARIGPREHAMRATEAASIYYPTDAPLLTLRRAKIPIATAYELGQISRTEYDERWQRAVAIYNQQADARMQGLRRELEAGIRNEQQQRLQALPRTCTSQVLLGRLVTTCQ